MWQNLSLEIAQEFANPHWIEITRRVAASANGLTVFHNADACSARTLSRKSDEQFAECVNELIPTQYTWTARELACAAGTDTHGAEGICGELLKLADWRLFELGGRHAWVNPAAVRQWCQYRQYLSLRDVSAYIGVPPRALAPILREAGWSEMRRGGKRVWVRAAHQEACDASTRGCAAHKGQFAPNSEACNAVA